MDDFLADLTREIEKRDNATGLLRVGYRTQDHYRRYRRKVGNVPNTVRWAYQRVTGGWDDRSLWSLDHALSRQLGEQLVTMADIAHGHPMDYTFEEWAGALRSNGETLQAFGRTLTPSEERDALYGPAQDAFRWVADNLGKLWD